MITEKTEPNDKYSRDENLSFIYRSNCQTTFF